MLITVQARLRKISRWADSLSGQRPLEKTTDAPAVKEESAAPPEWRRRCRGFHERHSTELILIRLLQVACVLLSFGVAHTLLDIHGWQHADKRLELACELGLTFMLYMVPAMVMPSAVPEFLVVMALPPCVNDGNMEALIAAIRSSNHGSNSSNIGKGAE